MIMEFITKKEKERLQIFESEYSINYQIFARLLDKDEIDYIKNNLDNYKKEFDKRFKHNNENFDFDISIFHYMLFAEYNAFKKGRITI